ncbi:hypothetical protein A6302_02638 [Methylobrevis pamukkalensis]|uniref:Uncharacterized protein n=1 Tax=Methylobrevis pamukkalensis TaxID=1439726 RepID=A0A1E3H3B8_9HYPH|nr:hypothetical protein A6302_02638 [Methylobrevis pamukkalensis]
MAPKPPIPQPRPFTYVTDGYRPGQERPLPGGQGDRGYQPSGLANRPPPPKGGTSGTKK